MSDVRLIDADVLLCKLNKRIGKIENGRSFRRELMPVTEGMRIMELEYCIGLVQCEPVIDAVPVVHGRWVREPRGIARCSYCDKGYRLTNGGANVLKFNYCPNCGAKMDGGAADV